MICPTHQRASRIEQAPEAAAWFHYKLAYIHPFPNGNGRHARLMTDVLLTSQARPRFDWGGGADLRRTGTALIQYISALQAADQGSLDQLIDFLTRSRERA